MKQCPDPILLSRLLDHELSGVERLRLEEHLAHCADCAAEVQQLRSISALLQSEGPSLGVKASSAFVARLEAMSDQLDQAVVFRFVSRLTGVAAAILLASTLTLQFHPPKASQRSPATYAPAEMALLDPDSTVSSGSGESFASLASDNPFDSLGIMTSGGRQ